MNLKEIFSEAQSDYQLRKTNPWVLDLYYSARGGSTYITFDFITRTMITRNGSSDGGVVVTPFSQLDREVVVAMHDHLTELGGKPPALAQETPSNPGSTQKLRP